MDLDDQAGSKIEKGVDLSDIGSGINHKILIVDDEPAITELVQRALTYEGYCVDVEETGYGALRAAIASQYDLIILDIMLPDIEGIDVCRKLRENGQNAPVIFLTARDSTNDKIEGLRTGADDYVTKPFSLAELIARIDANIRRSNQISVVTDRCQFEDLLMDLETYEVWRQGNRVELTATEFKLLHYLIDNARLVISKSQILDHVWEQGSDDPNVVETYISYLRKKIDCYSPCLIQTVRGIGYTLRRQSTN